MFDLLKFENNEIREMMIAQIEFDRFESFEDFVDLMKTEEIEIEHLEIESFESENIQ
jgi:hypothetical protein